MLVPIRVPTPVGKALQNLYPVKERDEAGDNIGFEDVSTATKTKNSATLSKDTSPNQLLRPLLTSRGSVPVEVSELYEGFGDGNFEISTTGPNVDVSKDYQASALITSGQSPSIASTEQVPMEIINNSELVQAGVKTPKGRGEEHLSDPPNTGSKMDMDDQSEKTCIVFEKTWLLKVFLFLS
ncbi:hypothetical protein CCACVL1_06914 [Corchorus capsularis]|uniref:Uncharacterized protein n=1 Tax=Corchorus capsularis TaxID=210143 RepID=A0A1R3JBG4_COCAP|nr:hypothetical protein CCACVL1_06914 [Corchorus capsularis]